MYVTGIAPTEAPAGLRSRRRNDTQDEWQQSGFSPRHVILDLSLEAMDRIGYRPLNLPRSPQPVLFVYDDRGTFAYDEAARRYEQARPVALPTKDGARAEEPQTVEITPPMPSTVSFDGMLGGNRR